MPSVYFQPFTVWVPPLGHPVEIAVTTVEYSTLKYNNQFTSGSYKKEKTRADMAQFSLHFIETR